MGYWKSRNHSLRTRPIEGSRRSSTSRKAGDKFPWQLSKQSEPLLSEPESNSSMKMGAEKACVFGSSGGANSRRNAIPADGGRGVASSEPALPYVECAYADCALVSW